MTASLSSISRLVQLGTRVVNTSNKELWRNSATIILATRREHRQPCEHIDDTNFDYEVLLLERSSKTKFMPRRNVFPGGIIEDSDFSPKWRDVFKKAGFGNNLSSPHDFGLHTTPFTPPLFKKTLNEDSILSEVAFRICAIRETFEECGILLVRDTKSVRGSLSSLRTKLKAPLLSEEIDEWRAKVDSDATEFIELCNQLNVVPDIWALKEWSNWLTPTNLTDHGERRYDTMFYFCSLDHVPDVSHCSREMMSAKWWTPEEILCCHMSNQLIIAPPQIYELSRLRRFHNLRDLEEFADSRSFLGVQRWLPVHLKCRDGIIVVMPGDDLYPKCPDLMGVDGFITLDGDVREVLCKSGTRNCFILKGSSRFLLCNADSNCGHKKPVTDLPKSKLKDLPKPKL